MATSDTAQSAQFADQAGALATARRLYPAAELQLIDHGYDNIVVLAGHDAALRFPRDQAALDRDNFEQYILKTLRHNSQMIDLPYVTGEGNNPQYFATHFVDGEHLQPATIRLFTPEQQRHIGEQVARFAFALHAALNGDDIINGQARFRLNEQPGQAWEPSIEQHLAYHTFPDPRQDAVAKKYYGLWRTLPHTPRIVVHDDLHVNNLLFVEHRLNGILDFGDTTVGTAEQELRHLYRINERVLKAGVRAYERQAGRQLNIEACRIWAIVQELVAYGFRGSAEQTSHPSFVRARQNLNRWFRTNIW